jgi:hypothetical protein
LVAQEESVSEGSDSEEGSDDDDGSDEGSYSEDDSEYDGEENEEERELKELVNNLPANLRQQVLKKEAAARRRKAGEAVEESDEGDSDAEDSGDEEEGWGRKKKTYWEGDTADLEIGQDMDDAIEEEAAAQDLQKQKVKRMKASDFMEEFAASGSEESASDSGSDDDDSVEQWGAKKGLTERGAASTVGNLAQVSLGQDEVESDREVLHLYSPVLHAHLFAVLCLSSSCPSYLWTRYRLKRRSRS